MSLDQNTSLMTGEPGTFMSSVQSDLDDATQPVPVNTDNIGRVLTSGFDYGANPQIADELRETATRVRKRTRRCLIENGHDLLRYRDKLKGHFHRWVKEECELTVRTAQLAMMVAEYVDLHGGHENFSRLPAAVQYQLAAPSLSDEVRQLILSACAEGRPPKVAEVKELVKASKITTEVPCTSAEDPPDEPNTAQSAQREQEPLETAAIEAHAMPGLSEAGPVPPQQAVSGEMSQEGLAPHVRAHEISKGKLNAASEDPAKQAIIKEIDFKSVNNMRSSDRLNFVSLLYKLGKVHADRLAECFQ